jgi:hypothetical protein
MLYCWHSASLLKMPLKRSVVQCGVVAARLKPKSEFREHERQEICEREECCTIRPVCRTLVVNSIFSQNRGVHTHYVVQAQEVC